MAQSVFEVLKSLLEERFEITPALVKPEAELQKELGLDSMDAVDLLLAVNEAFDIRVPTEALSDIHTVKDLVDLIERKSRGK